MKTFKQVIQWVFVICVMASVFAGNAKADLTVIIGQSNAEGIAKTSNIIGNLTNTKQVDCSHGGKYIALFLPGSEYMIDCIKKINGRDIKNIVFWQGESDAYSYSEYTLWSNRAAKVINRLLKDQTRRVNVVMVALHAHQDLRYWSTWNVIRDMQLRFKGVYKIDSEPYEWLNEYAPNGDLLNLHLTRQGYIDISYDIASKLNRAK